MTNRWQERANALFTDLGRLICQREDLDREIESVRTQLRALNFTLPLAQEAGSDDVA